MTTEICLAITGIVLAVGVPAYVEWMRKPRLEVAAADWKPSFPVKWAFLDVSVKNRLPGRLFRLLNRDDASATTLSADFRMRGSDARVLPTIVCRWSDKPQPIREQIDSAEGQVIRYFDESRVAASTETTIAPGAESKASIAMLWDNGKAFAFNSDSYQFPNLANPDWELPRGTYEVSLTARSGMAEAQKVLVLEFLDGDFAKFVWSSPVRRSGFSRMLRRA